MKARTTCPKCKHEFVTDVPENSDEHTIKCPLCSHAFIIKRTCKDEEKKEECGWEEHGEPRKTILSSFKKKTNRPVMASFLLLATSILGFFTAVFLESSENLIVPYLNIDLNFLINIIGNKGLFVVVAVFSIFAFIGFVAAFRRHYLGTAAFCAFLGIFSIGFFIGSILSIAALILIIISREEFEDGTKGKMF